MSLTLIDVRRIAADVARKQDPVLEVVGVTPAEGESSYVEVMLTVDDCRVEAPSLLIVGVNRDTSDRECRSIFQEHLQQHLGKRAGGVR